MTLNNKDSLEYKILKELFNLDEQIPIRIDDFERVFGSGKNPKRAVERLMKKGFIKIHIDSKHASKHDNYIFITQDGIQKWKKINSKEKLDKETEDKIQKGKEMEIITDKKRLSEEGLNINGIDKVIRKTITLHLEIIEFNKKGTYMTGSKHQLWVKDGENRNIPSLCGDLNNKRLPLIIKDLYRFLSNKLIEMSKEVLKDLHDNQ